MKMVLRCCGPIRYSALAARFTAIRADWDAVEEAARKEAEERARQDEAEQIRVIRLVNDILAAEETNRRWHVFANRLATQRLVRFFILFFCLEHRERRLAREAAADRNSATDATPHDETRMKKTDDAGIYPQHTKVTVAPAPSRPRWSHKCAASFTATTAARSSEALSIEEEATAWTPTLKELFGDSSGDEG